MKFLPLCLAFGTAASLVHAQQIQTPGYKIEVLHTGNGMTALDFDTTGRMYACEKQGRVLVFQPDHKGGFSAPEVFADFHTNVNPEGESGLLGIALDPQFPTNHFLYVFYTANTEQRLVRLTADASFTRAVDGSELVLLSGLPRTANNHKAGDIHFHPKDPKAIYLTLGDDTHRELATDLDHYNGKLLRLDASNGKGLKDNPFSDGNTDSIRSRIWARGLRNPFRFTFVPGGNPDAVYISENGDGTDRVVRVARGGDGGWGVDGDKGLLAPADSSTHILYTSKPCMTAIAIAPKGPFAPDGPALFAANWFSQEVLRWNLKGAQLDNTAPLPADQGHAFLTGGKYVGAAFGPDGALYLTQTYYSAVGNDHKLTRITATDVRRP